ncbi:MAG: DNA polymerase III subunit delta', partial [Rhodospirillales bacterium]|nr:DNA polymerase III subunit delta' [Rhodospirillales bacterium]
MENGSQSGAPTPRANPLLLGQGTAEDTLLTASRSGRLPHAWLLSGPRGIGKATLAYRFARFLLSDAESEQGLFGPAAQDLNVAPESETFRRVAAAGHSDLVTVALGVDEKSGKPRKEIVVKDVRSVGDFLHMTPGEGGWRIVVVDSADDMNQSAANALLKVLEEPPRQALLLLVSHAPGRLLPTIRSRCCQLPLQPLEDSLVIELLGRYAPNLAEDDRAALAQLSEGSIGRALDLSAGGGLELYRELIALLEGLPQLDVPRLYA